MNNAWIVAKRKYRENELDGVEYMKCSTAFQNPRASRSDKGVIILYCNNSSNKEAIINIGEKIIKELDYKESKWIFYKTNIQTSNGTIATGSKSNHTYKLFTHPYAGNCLIKI